MKWHKLEKMKTIFVSKTLASVLYYLVYFCGLVYTGIIIFGNVMAYFKYNSTFSQRQLLTPLSEVTLLILLWNFFLNIIKSKYVRLPNLMICSDSLHSKKKVQKYFPNVTDKMIEKLYGFNVTRLQKSIWNFRKTEPGYFRFLQRKYLSQYKFENKINMTDFYTKTAPVYYLFHCHMKTVQCRAKWKLKVSFELIIYVFIPV